MNHWSHNTLVFCSKSGRLNQSMEKWCVRAQDLVDLQTVDVYVEAHSSIVPLGLLPGS